MPGVGPPGRWPAGRDADRGRPRRAVPGVHGLQRRLGDGTSTCCPGACAGRPTARSDSPRPPGHAIWLASCPGGISGAWPGRPTGRLAVQRQCTQSVPAQSQ
jgi:hypothetical protein